MSSYNYPSHTFSDSRQINEWYKDLYFLTVWRYRLVPSHFPSLLSWGIPWNILKENADRTGQRAAGHMWCWPTLFNLYDVHGLALGVTISTHGYMALFVFGIDAFDVGVSEAADKSDPSSWKGRWKKISCTFHSSLLFSTSQLVPICPVFLPSLWPTQVTMPRIERFASRAASKSTTALFKTLWASQLIQCHVSSRSWEDQFPHPTQASAKMMQTLLGPILQFDTPCHSHANQKGKCDIELGTNGVTKGGVFLACQYVNSIYKIKVTKPKPLFHLRCWWE